MNDVQYLTGDKYQELKSELSHLKKDKKRELAKRIDDARQMGDLSENAEYHAAREEMAWVLSRIQEIEKILDNAQIIEKKKAGGFVSIGSVVLVEVNGKQKKYTIVGAQEAEPMNGKISNESPLGSAFLGKIAGDMVEVNIPSGIQSYKILSVE